MTGRGKISWRQFTLHQQLRADRQLNAEDSLIARLTLRIAVPVYGSALLTTDIYSDIFFCDGVALARGKDHSDRRIESCLEFRIILAHPTTDTRTRYFTIDRHGTLQRAP